MTMRLEWVHERYHDIFFVGVERSGKKKIYRTAVELTRPVE